MGITVETARKQYYELGFDTLPLIGGSKRPYARAWQSRMPYRLWQNSPQNANIGIRGGGFASVAFIDCDEYQAFENVTNHLAGLGYRGDSYPVVQTASGDGRHIYVTLAGALSGEARNLSKEVGKGEFRYGPGAFVVAPPSFISDGSGYQLLSGDFEIRPKLEVKDLLPLLGNRETATERKPTLSRKARKLLHGNIELIESYQSRSEAEQALITSLFNSGFSFEEIHHFFNHFPCAGKYTELKAKNAKNAEYWLNRSYSEAVEWATNNESEARRLAKSAMEWAESTAWPGRTGAIDRLVYLAHAGLAYKAGRLTYAAACRDLADMAGVGRMTASRSTWRLCKSGLLSLDTKAVAEYANIYQLSDLDKVGHSLNAPNERECPTLSNHDVFRYGGLGKSAGEVYAALQAAPATVGELSEITGRHIKTIERALSRMAKLADRWTGEFLPMVASDDGEIFYALPVDLDHIARIVRTVGKGEKQRREHEKERRDHARGLERGRER